MTRGAEELVIVLDAVELGPPRPVGVLSRVGGPGGSVAFSYVRSWLADDARFPLDPRLLLVRGPQPIPGGTIPSILADTMPGGWGQRVMDARAGRGLDEWGHLVGVTDATRLGGLRLLRPGDAAFVGDADGRVPTTPELRMLQNAAAELERTADRSPTDPVVAALAGAGSVLGGSRPKVTFRGTDGSLWIAKFPSRSDERSDVGAWELVFTRLAAAAGITVAQVDTTRLGGLGRTFVARRFDRAADGSRRLFASARTLADVEDHRAGYPDIARAISFHGAPGTVREDLAQLFRRLAFNVLAGNRDDHLRNHGFLRHVGGWRLAPAFDLNPSWPPREHAITLDGHTRRPHLAAAVATHRLYGLSAKEAQAVVTEVAAALAGWPAEAERAGIARVEQATVGVTFAQLGGART